LPFLIRRTRSSIGITEAAWGLEEMAEAASD
jgi:hypothetical protein